MFDFANLSRRQRIIQRNRTERLSEMLDWRNLGIYYRKARNQALTKVYGDKAVHDPSAEGEIHLSRPASAAASPHSSRASTPVRDFENEENDDHSHIFDDEEAPIELKSQAVKS